MQIDSWIRIAAEKPASAFGAEPVDDGLDQHHTDRHRGLLQNRGQRDLCHAPELRRVVQLHLAAAELLQLPDQHGKGEHRRNPPARSTSPTRRPKPPSGKRVTSRKSSAMLRSEEKIKKHSGIGFAERVEHRRKHVVHKEERQAVEIDVQILDRHIQNICRCVEQHHDAAAEKNGRRRAAR